MRKLFCDECKEEIDEDDAHFLLSREGRGLPQEQDIYFCYKCGRKLIERLIEKVKIHG